MTALLVWVLIVGEAGGYKGAVQMGPFATEQDCERVASSSVLSKFQKQCIQVNMAFVAR